MWPHGSRFATVMSCWQMAQLSSLPANSAPVASLNLYGKHGRSQHPITRPPHVQRMLQGDTYPLMCSAARKKAVYERIFSRNDEKTERVFRNSTASMSFNVNLRRSANVCL
jgi:hypothetical protein